MGTRIKFRRVAVTIPPTVGVAMGFMISAPVPVLIKMGIRARMVVAVVMIMGLTLSNPP
jgi:hypothetical protein